jgi:hypothetical protein
MAFHIQPLVCRQPKYLNVSIPKNKHLTDNDQPNLKHSEDFDETCNNLNIGNMPVLTPVTNVIPRDVHHGNQNI